MKKIVYSLIALCLLIPSIVIASDVDYDITDYYINANILDNGDLEVEELIVLDGTFNGYIRDIVYKNDALNDDSYSNNKIYNASGIELSKIEAKKVKDVSFATFNDSDFKTLKSGVAANNGFIKTAIINGNSYKMYFRSDDEKVAFKLSYIIKDVVVLHNDIAELYWTFIGEEYDDVIRNLNIRVNLPRVDESDNFRVWAHGDLNGNINKYDSYLEANIDRLNSYSSVDIRSTFAKNLVNSDNISKKSGNDAFLEILKVEQERADIANKKRQAQKNKKIIMMVVAILYYIFLIIIWIYTYIKYDKEYPNTLNTDYYRDFIDDYNVEVVDYLFNKNITPNALSAAIMNLVYKKNITLEEIASDKKKKEYLFTLKNTNNLNDTEKYLVSFLFETVGSDNKFSTSDLKSYAKSSKTCEKFSSKYSSWKSKVIKDGKEQNFFEKKGTATCIGALTLAFAVLIVVISISFDVDNIFIYASLIAGIIFFIYTTTFTKRTIKGNDHFCKWKAFKKFLIDFGDFKVKELPEISLWDKYMVYATVFGIADKVSKAMNVKINEMQTEGIYVNTPTFMDFYIFNSLSNSISSTVNANRTAITNMNSSSGSGFGGGFSSGGGFGGGGGGGHGF